MKYSLFIFVFICACSSADGNIGSSKQALYESDDNNCGALGYACVAGRTCTNSRCAPAWISMETEGSPSARGFASAAFLDGKYVLFGGCDSTSGTPAALSSGVTYDISNNTWGSSTPVLNQARALSSVVTTDAGIFVFGGVPTCYDGSVVNSGLEVLYSLSDSWSSIQTNLEPSGRFGSSLIWTGDDLIVYGGSQPFSAAVSSGALLSLGSAWKDISCPLSGCERGGQFAAFFDNGMLHVWGGGPYGSAPDGLLYDIDHKTWYNWVVPTNTPDFTEVQPVTAPSFADDNRRLYYLSDNGHVLIFDRKTQSWTDDNSSPLTGFCAQAAAAWTGSELVAWGGFCNGNLSSVGGRYQPPAPIVP